MPKCGKRKQGELRERDLQDQLQRASAACISHQNFSQLVQFEKEFGYTLKRDTDLSTLIKKGVPYHDITPELARLATSYQ